jgi:hypothetical protein
MVRILTGGLVLLASGVFTVAAAADEDKDKLKAKDLPVELRIVAKKATYTLDLGGKSADEFRQAIKAAADTGAYPPAPTVDLVLELKNTSDKDIQVWLGGDPTRIMLELKGPGAVNQELKALAFTTDFRMPKPLALPAGKSHKIELKSLSHGHRGASHRSYWVEPGQYTLTARFVTGIAPAPDGSEKAEGGFGRVTITSQPIKLKVEAK